VAAVAFVVPLVFIGKPGLLWVGSAADVLVAIATVGAGAVAMTVAFEGWWRGALSGALRVTLLLAAVGLFVPAIEINLVAGVALSALAAWRLRRPSAA
jgi:TRAP-type uncharacterized transport system fused permease subunit